MNSQTKGGDVEKDLEEVQQDLLIAVARCSISRYGDFSRGCKDSEILRCFNDRRMKDNQTTLTTAETQLDALKNEGYITLRILAHVEVHGCEQDETFSYRLESKGCKYLSERGFLPVNRRMD